jgi:hypothetical protein
MSDFGDPTLPRPPTTPPPPPGSSPFPPQQPPPPPPPPSQFGTPSPYAGGQSFGAPGSPSPYGPQSAFGQQQYVAMSKPRPPVPVGGVLLLLGGAMTAVGSFLTWFTVEGQDYTGFSKGSTDDVKDGPFFLVFGLILLGFGVSLLVARKVLAVAIIGIVAAAVTVIFALADLGSVDDNKKLARAFDLAFSTGPGLYLCVFGGLIALAGSIVATATRRR